MKWTICPLPMSVQKNRQTMTKKRKNMRYFTILQLYSFVHSHCVFYLKGPRGARASNGNTKRKEKGMEVSRQVERFEALLKCTQIQSCPALHYCKACNCTPLGRGEVESEGRRRREGR